MPTTDFSTQAEFSAMLADMPDADAAATNAAQERNGVLTKPPGALGRLEDVAIWYAGWRGEAAPQIKAPQALIFAGNHGVVAQGVSAFPAEVTAQMVMNFDHGGAAINQLCAAFGVDLSVHAIELESPTADFTMAPAMEEAAFVAALKTGWDAVNSAADLLITGEMGIGNTTCGAAIAAALFGGEPEDWVGRGTGVDDEGLARKADVIGRAIALHGEALSDPIETLRRLGGYELAAMVGAVARARFERIPVIIDGFICTAALATLALAQPGALDHCVAGHVSAESAHAKLLDELGLEPLLSLGMRLGEGSGAALAVGILKGALACHSNMATFAEAGVSDG